MIRALVAVLFLITSAAVASGARLCLDGSACRDYACGERLGPTNERRRFTLTDSGGERIRIGVLPPGDSRIICAGHAEIELRVGARQLRPSTNVRIRVASTEDAWEWSASARQLRKPVRIVLPQGGYDLAISAPGFRRVTRHVVAVERPQIVSATLEPLPNITGVVVDRDGTPVAGALIRSDAEAEDVTDGTGRFAVAADPERWPKQLTISAAGYAEARIGVPPARASMSVDEIRLSRGGTVIIDLHDANGAVEKIELVKVSANGRSLGAVVQTLDPREKRAFTNIEPGRYLVIARGKAAWERLGEPVEVEAASEARIPLRIAPFLLRTRASYEGKPLGNARVRIQNRDALWEGSFDTDERGEASVALWQGGRMWATLLAPAIMPYKEARAIEDGVDAEWTLEVPAYEVTGVVVDDTTGKGIAGAKLVLQMDTIHGYHLGVKGTARDDGTFRFAPVAHGQHELSAAAAGYPPTTIQYDFDESTEQRRVTVRLTRAETVQLRVIDSRGLPIAGARVVAFQGSRQGAVAVTDDSGSVSVEVPAGEIRTVYVVPRDGSLAIAPVRAGSAGETIRVPDGLCRIVLRMQSTDRKPIANVSVAVRYNGQMLPVEIIQMLIAAHGGRFRSDGEGRVVFQHLPAGAYEFWPAGSPAEMRAVAAAGTGAAPVKIAAAPGENVAVMTFEAVSARPN